MKRLAHKQGERLERLLIEAIPKKMHPVVKLRSSHDWRVYFRGPHPAYRFTGIGKLEAFDDGQPNPWEQHGVARSITTIEFGRGWVDRVANAIVEDVLPKAEVAPDKSPENILHLLGQGKHPVDIAVCLSVHRSTIVRTLSGRARSSGKGRTHPELDTLRALCLVRRALLGARPLKNNHIIPRLVEKSLLPDNWNECSAETLLEWEQLLAAEGKP